MKRKGAIVTKSAVVQHSLRFVFLCFDLFYVCHSNCVKKISHFFSYVVSPVVFSPLVHSLNAFVVVQSVKLKRPQVFVLPILQL